MMSRTIEERYHAIKRINHVAVTATTPENVFRGMCETARGLLPYDRAALAVYDPEADVLKLVARVGRFNHSFFRIGAVLGRKDSHQGWTFEHKRSILRRDVSKEWEFQVEEHTIAEGFQSYCAVPLILRGDSIGVITFLSRQKGSYARPHADLLQELSNPIVLAVKSFVAYCPAHVYTRLICPRCIASSGGQITTTRYKNQLSEWGKKGGRGKKRKAPGDDYWDNISST